MVKSSQVAKAFRTVGAKNAIRPLPYEKTRGFYFELEDGVLFLYGENDAQAIVETFSRSNGHGFIDNVSARIFSLLGKARISLELEDGKLVITENSEVVRSVTRINIDKFG